jgi:L-2,4-diaminobutyrate transaminase
MFGHGYTMSAHPLCATAALANLEILEKERLLEHVAATSAHFHDRLKEIFAGRRYVAEVRGVGFLAAIEFAEDPAERTRFDAIRNVGLKIASACIDEGVLVRALPHGDIVGFAPPLIATRAELDDIIARVSRAVDRVTHQL